MPLLQVKRFFSIFGWFLIINYFISHIRLNYKPDVVLAADAYFISTAILLNSILISNDQKQAIVAKTKNINVFYLIEQNEQINQYLEKSPS